MAPRSRSTRLLFAGVAGVLVVVAVLVAAWNRGGGGGEDKATSQAVERRPDVRMSTTRHERPVEGATQVWWAAPGSDGVLMIPAVAPDGTVWAGQLRSNQLMQVYAPSGSVTAVTLPVDDATARVVSVLAASPIHLWLTLEGRHALAFVDLELQTYREFRTPAEGSSPFGLAADAEGHLWLTESTAGRLARFHPESERFEEYALPDAEAYPYLLTVGRDGRVWFTMINRPMVGVLDPANGAISLLRVPELGEADGTTGIATGTDGAVWFGTLSGRLGRIDPATLAITTAASPGAQVYGVAVGGDGTIWLAGVRQEVYAYRPGEGRFCTVSTGADARWLTFGGDGALWVSEGQGAGNGLRRIAPEVVTRPCQ